MIGFIPMASSVRCSVCGEQSEGHTYRVFREDVKPNGAKEKLETPIFCCIGECSDTMADAMESKALLVDRTRQDDLQRLAEKEFANP